MTQIDFDYLPVRPSVSRPFDPAPELDRIRGKRPAVRVRLPDGSTPWLILSHDLARTLLTDKRLSSDVNVAGFPVHGHIGGNLDVFARSMIRQDEPDHMRLRKLVAAEFRPARVQQLDELITSVVDGAITALRSVGPPADLIEHFALAIPTRVIAHVMGVPEEQFEPLHRCTGVLTSLDATEEETDSALAELGRCMQQSIERTLTEPGDNLLTKLRTDVDSGHLDADEAVSMAVLLVLAGHETTANTLALSVAELLTDPALIEALRKEDVLDTAIEEFLRYNSVVRGGPRRVALEDITCGDLQINRFDGLIFSLHNANRDPASFASPDALHFDRENVREHLAFGFGMHQCVGQALARRELRSALSALLREFPGMSMVEDGLSIRPERSIYGLQRLLVSW